MDFADALDAALAARAETTGELPPGEQLALTLSQVRSVLPTADNLGATQDDRDLYHLIDTVSDGVRSAFPGSRCQAGCSACCHYPVSLFNVAPAEWKAIARHIETTWDRERLLGFVERFWREHGPALFKMRVLGFLVTLPLPIIPRESAIPPACPFLEDDRCAVYPVRPAHCRSFGHFTVHYWWRRTPFIYGCLEQIARLREALARPGQAPLPSLNPFDVKLWGLAPGKGKLLALWTARTWPRRTLERLSGTARGGEAAKAGPPR